MVIEDTFDVTDIEGRAAAHLQSFINMDTTTPIDSPRVIEGITKSSLVTSTETKRKLTKGLKIGVQNTSVVGSGWKLTQRTRKSAIIHGFLDD